MGECKRQGAWLVPADHTAFTMMGSVTLDLRTATFAERDITITANAIMGEVSIIVDAGTHVVVSGVPIMGEFHQAKDKVAPQLGPDSPVVRIKGFALMGSVTVQRQPAPGTRKKLRGPTERRRHRADGTPGRPGVPTVRGRCNGHATVRTTPKLSPRSDRRTRRSGPG